MESLPFHWPLAKLTLALKFGVNRLDGLVVGYLMELMATHSDPSSCRKQINSFAKTLTVRVATYLAKEIASLFRPVLYHPVMFLTDDDTLPLLTSEFWIRPVYEELLHAASRFNLSSGAELKRPTSNLVKIASHFKDKPSDMMNSGDQHTTMTDWLGADCPVDYLNVWFPAHWSPIVLRELHGREVAYRNEHMLWFDAPANASDQERVANQRKDALRSRELHFHLGAMDGDNNLPTLIGKLSSSLPHSKKASFVVCLNKKQLVPGLAVAQKRPKSRFFSQGIAALVSGLIWLTVCLTVGLRVSISAECKWAHFGRQAFTSIASSHVPDICGSS